METDFLWAAIDEYGELVGSSYLPMLGSRIVPNIPIATSIPQKQVRFKIDMQGTIFGGSPPNLDGRKLVLPGGSPPPQGRSDIPIPGCTWRADGRGGWT
jgi:hypothetical protein